LEGFTIFICDGCVKYKFVKKREKELSKPSKDQIATAGKNKMKINVLKNIQGISKMRELILRRSRAC
jgi:hypothetical protein